MTSFKINLLSVISAIVLIVFHISCNNSAKVAQSSQLQDSDWFAFQVSDLDTTTSEVDLSFLNEEMAGESGFVKVENGHFVNGRGEPIRFFGTNLTFAHAFPDKETAILLAKRLGKFGFNVVRFHHLDMNQAPRGIWDETMEAFDPEMVDRLDWLIYQLKQEGIYSNLNLHVSRTYPGMNNEHRKFRFGKTIDQFYRPFIDMQKDFAKDLLTHTNPYTGNAYSHEPAVAFIEINNENSLLSNWDYLAELKGDHLNAIQDLWNNWLDQNQDHKSSTTDQQDVIWISKNYKELASEDQKMAFWAFMVETEMAYSQEMIDYLKTELRVNQPISVTQASYSGIAGVVREAKYADFIDLHAYWEHPRFPNAAWSRTDWLIKNSSMVSNQNGGTLARFAMHRVQNMPLTISEYDHPSPNDFCAEMYPMLMSMAAYQNWDGIYHFNFDGPWESRRINGFFSGASHPLKQVFLPVGALMFRAEGVTSGKDAIRLHLPEREVLPKLVEYGDLLRLHGSNMDKIWESVDAPKALTLLHPTEIVLGGSELYLSKPVQPPSGSWISQTGEITWDHRDSAKAIYTINSPMVKAVIGYVGGRTINLGSVSMDIPESPSNWASIAMTSMDKQPIESSNKILLVAAGTAENTDMGWNKERTSVGGDWGEAPVLVEGITAKITWSFAIPHQMMSLNGKGNRKEEIPITTEGNNYSSMIGPQYKTLWYLLEG